MAAFTENQLENQKLQAIVNDFALLLFESKLYHSGLAERQIVAEVFGDAITQCYSIKRRLEVNPGRQVIAFVGMTNVGKSTLLNSLLDSRGRNITPRRNGPCTSAPIEFVYGSTLTTTCVFQNQLHRPRREYKTIEELNEHLSELVAASEPEVVPPTKVTVTLPSRLLHDTGVTIADTPGFGSASLGNDSVLHEQRLRQYLLNEATQVFWVVLAEQGIGRIEKEFYSNHFADICDDVIVTGSEDWPESDRIRFQQRFEQVVSSKKPLGRRSGFMFVSGKQALRALSTGDKVMLQSSGISAISERISTFSREPASIANAESSLRQLSLDLAAWLGEYKCNGSQLFDWLRPDSFSRWRAKVDGCHIRTELTSFLKPPVWPYRT